MLILVGMLVPSLGPATAQQPDELERRAAGLDIQRLELEIDRLRQDRPELPTWFIGAAGILVGILGTAASVWVARRTRLAALDQSVHDARLKSYPRLVAAAAPLALYFPSDGSAPSSIGANECRAMGRAMSKWYFAGGGLLLSTGARDAYFKLARALTRASLAQALRVPVFPADADDICLEKIDDYRDELAKEQPKKRGLDDVEDWVFGGTRSDDDPPYHRFKDFVFLQTLSSALRSALSEDLRSRRRPS